MSADNSASSGSLVLLTGPDGKRFLVTLTPGEKVHTHLGYLPHDRLIEHPFGASVPTQLGHPFLLLRASTLDVIMHAKRISQIIYPKDIAYILFRLNIFSGSQVVEAGTGSGALTIALARAVTPGGLVHTYEERQDMQQVAIKNLTRAGLAGSVQFRQRDIRAGFDERNADALFLDVREPWQFLAQAHAALQPGAFFGSLVPTTNQVSDLLAEMERMDMWSEIEVCEILLRNYKPVADRLRPVDRMVAHTGYLIFARSVAAQFAAQPGLVGEQAFPAEPEIQTAEELIKLDGPAPEESRNA